MTLESYPNRLTRKAEDLIRDAAYEEAAEDGWIRWFGATRVEPGYWNADLDIEYGDLTVGIEDDPHGELYMTAVVKCSGHTLWDGVVSFWVDAKGYLTIESMELS